MGISVQSTLGAAFFGFMAATILYGVNCIQTFWYYGDCKRDGYALKTLVATLWILDSLHTAFIAHALYTYLIIDFFNPFAALLPVWSLIALQIVSALVEFCVRWVFTIRIHKLSHRNWVLSAPLGVLNVAVLVISLYFSAKCFGFHDFSLIENSWIVYLAFSMDMFADLAITVIVCILLIRSRTGHTASDRLIHRLMVYVIHGGVLATVITTVILITYAAMPGTYIFMAIFFTLSKVCLNSLLTSLNARKNVLQLKADFEDPKGGFPIRPLNGMTDGVLRSELLRSASLGTRDPTMKDWSAPKWEAGPKEPVTVQMTTVTTKTTDDGHERAYDA